MAPQAVAGIHIEPYMGLSWSFSGKKAFTEIASSLQENQKSQHYFGPTPGLRLGWSTLGLAVGLDASLGYWQSVFKEDFSDRRTKKIPMLWGLFASYKFPLLWRAYVVIIPPLSNVLFISQSQNNTHCSKTAGAKFGFSWISLPFIGINIEYSPMYISGGHCRAYAHTGSAYVNLTF